MRVYLESLGCARNLVDSEIMIGRLKKAGWTLTDDPAEADTIVVNTCSFIESAAEESIDAILELAEFKKDGACNRLVVTGCLSTGSPPLLLRRRGGTALTRGMTESCGSWSP